MPELRNFWKCDEHRPEEIQEVTLGVCRSAVVVGPFMFNVPAVDFFLSAAVMGIASSFDGSDEMFGWIAKESLPLTGVHCLALDVNGAARILSKIFIKLSWRPEPHHVVGGVLVRVRVDQEARFYVAVRNVYDTGCFPSAQRAAPIIRFVARA